MTTQLDVQGRRTIEYWTNKSGGAVAYGDVVINDSANDEAFTTTTTAGFIGGQIGVVIEVNGIASNAQGRIAVGGHVEQINLNASGTRGHFVKTHTVAKQATDAGASRVAGAFAVLETTGTTPKATLFGIPDGSTGSAGSPGTPALTLGTTNATGAAVTLVATDATIAAFDATAPTTQAFGDAAAAGSAGVAARRDHKHAWPALGTTAAAVGTSAGGSATTPSKSDHVHATGAGTPSTQAFGDAAATGSGPAAAMTDHKHAMPAFSYAGYNTVGGSFKNMNGTYAKKITLAAGAWVTGIGAHVKGNATNAASLGVAIFSDSAGTPLKLVARGGAGGSDGTNALFTAFINATAGWIDFPISFYTAAGGDFWICILGGNGGGGTQLAYDAANVDKISTSLYPADNSLTAFGAATNTHSIRALILA